MMIKIVHDELSDLMGKEKSELNLKGSPCIILLAGLQGSGKTTISGKLANFLKSKKGKNPVLVACDVYRPAAIEQLKVLGEQINVPVYTEDDNKNPVKIAKEAIKQAKIKGHDVVIVDTAGRLAIDAEMMNEISDIKKAISPHEILFVVDSMTGQDAVNTLVVVPAMLFAIQHYHEANHSRQQYPQVELIVVGGQSIAKSQKEFLMQSWGKRKLINLLPILSFWVIVPF